MMTRLREICCDARLLYENVTLPSTKLRGCMDSLLNARKQRLPCIAVFQLHLPMLELIEEQPRVEKYTVSEADRGNKKELRHAHVGKFQNGGS